MSFYSNNQGLYMAKCDRLETKVKAYEDYFKDNNLEDPILKKELMLLEKKAREVRLLKEYWYGTTKKNGEFFIRRCNHEAEDVVYCSTFCDEYSKDPYYKPGFYDCYNRRVDWKYVQYKFII